MTDYHGFTTSYDYDDNGRLETLTAPGSKVWSYYYNALNQPTEERLPNGMASFYTYDTLNRLDKIDHKDAVTSGSTVLSFDYLLDDNGSIERIDENDGGYWAYDYDGRNRLTQADYTTALGPVAHYAYTYDDGDNMTQKVEPFQDDFNDENMTGWTATGTWSASGGVARNTPATTVNLNLSNSGAIIEADFRYTNNDTSNTNYGVYARIRSNSNGTNRLELRLYSNRIVLQDVIGGTVTNLLNSTSYPSTQGQAYDVKCVASGSSVKIYRGLAGQEPALIYSGTTATSTTSRFDFALPSNSDISLDNVRILSDDLTSTWVMTPNDANELTQMTNSAQGTTIDYTYDDWGRTATKSMGAADATYAYRYASMLYSVTSDYPDEGNVTFQYGGDMNCHERHEGAEVLVQRFANEMLPVSTEDSNGVVQHTYPGYQALFEGDTPSDSSYQYFLREHSGSIRQLRAHNKSLSDSYMYTAFGDSYYDNQGTIPSGYAFLTPDPAAGLQLGKYRAYDSSASRWLQRDPEGDIDGPNRYSYVQGNPVMAIDPLGLSTGIYYCHRKLNYLGGGVVYILSLGLTGHSFFRFRTATLTNFPGNPTSNGVLPGADGLPSTRLKVCTELSLSNSGTGEPCPADRWEAWDCLDSVPRDPGKNTWLWWPGRTMNNCNSWANKAMKKCCLDIPYQFIQPVGPMGGI